MTRTVQRRRTVFIKRGFQGRFLAWVIGLLVLAGACSAMILYLLLASELGTEMQSAHHQMATTWQRLGPAILAGNLLALVIAGLAAAIAVLYISHKIAGPLYRFERLCAEVAAGNLEFSTALRESDQLQGLADAFGAMLVKLRAQRDARTRGPEMVSATLAELEATAAQYADVKELSDRLRREVAAVVEGKEVLRHFPWMRSCGAPATKKPERQ